MNIRKMADCHRIYQRWHALAKRGDVAGLLSLYAKDAVLESPLTLAILPEAKNGTLIGLRQIEHFLQLGTARRPNELVRWYRCGDYFTDGQTLIWEYPRATPFGEQVDILELMTVHAGKIHYHRIYWGWKGCSLIAPALANRRF